MGDAFDLDKAADMIDDKMARNMAADLRKHLGADALKPHKPLLSGPGVGRSGIPISQGRSAIYGGGAARIGGLHGASKDLASIA